MKTIELLCMILIHRIVIGFIRTDAYLARCRGDMVAAAQHDAEAHRWMSSLVLIYIRKRGLYGVAK